MGRCRYGCVRYFLCWAYAALASTGAMAGVGASNTTPATSVDWVDAPVISYAQIEAGGKLDFVMGPKPLTWAAGWHAQPVQ
jgi:hypothetical protein